MTTSESQAIREREGLPPGVPCWSDTEPPEPAEAMRGMVRHLIRFRRRR